MASNNGYLTHCRICGTPIFSLGTVNFALRATLRTGAMQHIAAMRKPK